MSRQDQNNPAVPSSPSGSRPAHSRDLLYKLLLALGSILLLVVFMEGFARLVLKVQPARERFQLDPQLGWVWTPGYDAFETYHGVTYRMHISRQGLRNEPVAVPKPQDTYRIIALGDSITEGPGVELEGTFAKLLQNDLQSATSDENFEVIDAGTGDYGTEQELIWLRRRGLAYQPDLVIVEVYLNDSRSFSRPAAVIARLHNFFFRHSAFYTYYFNTVRGQRVAHEEAQADFRFRFGQEWEDKAWQTDSQALTRLIEEAGQDWGLAWDSHEIGTIETYLDEMIQLSNQQGFKLLLVLFPVDVQVYARVDTPLGLDRPQQELLAFAQQRSVPALDLLPILRTHQSEDLFYDQAHLKPETHQLVAQAILDALYSYGLIPQP